MTSPGWWSALRPPPLRPVSEWADAERVLTTEASAQAGPWRTDTTPYLREIMDRMSASDPCERVDVMMASQLGKTEAILNVIGYVATDCPGPVLMVQPRDEDIRRYSRQRVAPMIRSSVELRSRFADARGRDGGASMALREFAGGALIMASAQSPAGLASMPIRVVLLDEVDRYPESAGAEGDPIDLAIQRTVSFARRKILLTSTPTAKGRSRIEAALAETGWREYHIPCPHCDHEQPWEWEALRWEPGRPDTAMLHCRACGAGIDERDKRELLLLGRWVPRHPGREDGRRYGYHASGLIAPYGWQGSSWRALAERWERSERDPSRRRVLVNTGLARTYDESEQTTVDPDSLQGRAEDYGAGVEAPSGAVVVTAGVDVQQDRLEVSVYGWGAGEECWLLSHAVLPGDPSGPALWDDLDALLQRRWRHASGAMLPVEAVCVDSGYLAETVQAWCAARRARRIYATKGASTPTRGVWPARGSRGKRGSGHAVYLLGVGAAKDALWRRLQRSDPGPGAVHTARAPHPAAPDSAWYEQIMAERPTMRAGQMHWERPRGARAEALDCWVYAYAGLLSMGSSSRTLARAALRLPVLPVGAAATAAEPPTSTAPTPPPAAPTPPRHRRPQTPSWLAPGARLR